MTIDAETLEEAIKFARDTWHFGSTEGIERFKIIMAAAEHTLATLPRYKEVEVVQWATFDGHDVHRVFDHEDAADADASDINSGLVVVRLTGTAKVKVTP